MRYIPFLLLLGACEGQLTDSSGQDLDGDGYTHSDCDDDDPEIHYGAEECCDGVDNDCDGEIDDEDDVLEGAATWYADLDGDGDGDADDGLAACAQPKDRVEDDSDCDDEDGDIHPAAADGCDGVDEDCDGDVDEDCDED